MGGKGEFYWQQLKMKTKMDWPQKSRKNHYNPRWWFQNFHLQFFHVRFFFHLWGWVTQPPRIRSSSIKKPCKCWRGNLEPPGWHQPPNPSCFQWGPPRGYCSVLCAGGHCLQMVALVRGLMALLSFGSWEMFQKNNGISMEYQQLHCHNHELELCMYVIMCVCWTKRRIGRLVLGSLSWWNVILQLAFQESHNLFWYGWFLVSQIPKKIA